MVCAPNSLPRNQRPGETQNLPAEIPECGAGPSEVRTKFPPEKPATWANAKRTRRNPGIWCAQPPESPETLEPRHGADLVGHVDEVEAVLEVGRHSGQGAQGPGEFVLEFVGGEPRVQDGGGVGVVAVEGVGEGGSEDEDFDLEVAGFGVGDALEAKGGLADAGLGGVGDQAEDGGELGEPVVSGSDGDAVERSGGKLGLVFVHELAGQAECGGDGGGVGAPDQGVETDGVEAQHGGVGGDHGPVGVEGAGFVEVLEDGVGEFVEVAVHAGGATGHAGFQ